MTNIAGLCYNSNMNHFDRKDDTVKTMEGNKVEYIETNPLPECCLNCTEPDEGYCDECDHLGERFILPKHEQIKLDSLKLKKCMNQETINGKMET